MYINENCIYVKNSSIRIHFYLLIYPYIYVYMLLERLMSLSLLVIGSFLPYLIFA